MNRKNPREISPVEVYFDLIGGKYKATIIWYLAQKQPRRFGEIARCLPKNSPKALTNQHAPWKMTDSSNAQSIRKSLPAWSTH